MPDETLKEIRERMLRDEQVETRIRIRAYEIYEQRGGAPGNEAEDWLQAEGEILMTLIEEEVRASTVREEIVPAPVKGEAKTPPRRQTKSSAKEKVANPTKESRRVSTSSKKSGGKKRKKKED
jgi:hypothetical protein